MIKAEINNVGCHAATITGYANEVAKLLSAFFDFEGEDAFTPEEVSECVAGGQNYIKVDDEHIVFFSLADR